MEALFTVTIGMLVLWILLSIGTMDIQNRISIMLNWRADLLEKTMHDMLKDPELVKELYNHPLIQQLTPRDKNNKLKRPDYIPQKVFAEALFEILAYYGLSDDEVKRSLSLEIINRGIKNLEAVNPSLSRTLKSIFPNLDRPAIFKDKIAECKLNIENMYANNMGQASAIYKQRAQIIAFFVGLGISLFLNIDTINIAQKLWQEPTTRAVIVAQAQTQVTEPDLPSTDHLAKVQSLAFPIGWTTIVTENQTCSLIDTQDYQLVIRSAGQCRLLTGFPALNNSWGLMIKMCGYLLSAMLAAQGAPLWSDILHKLFNTNNT